MIQPSIGRVVLVHRGNSAEQWEPALICHVFNDQVISVAGFDQNGDPFKVTNIELLQEPVADDSIQVHPGYQDRTFACWMPYQRAQAEGKRF